jgi:hypothetical protein
MILLSLLCQNRLIVWIVLMIVTTTSINQPIFCNGSSSSSSDTLNHINHLYDSNNNIKKSKTKLNHISILNRFRSIGPMVTITIPNDITSSWNQYNFDHTTPPTTPIATSTATNNHYELQQQQQQHEIYTNRIRTKLQHIQQQFYNSIYTTIYIIQPSCIYTITTKSQQLPLPDWLPSLKSYTKRIGYNTYIKNNNKNNKGYNNHHPTMNYNTINERSTSNTEPILEHNNNHMNYNYHLKSYLTINRFIESLLKFEFNLNHHLKRGRNKKDVVQLSIKPCQEWITTTTSSINNKIPYPTTTTGATTDTSSNNDHIHEQRFEQEQQHKSSSSSSSSSILFHLRNGNANYGWLRFISSNSRISKHPSIPNKNEAKMTHTMNTPYHEQQQQQQQYSQTTEERKYEVAIRTSTMIPIPLASISNMRITPTMRYILQQQSQLQPYANPIMISKKQKKKFSAPIESSTSNLQQQQQYHPLQYKHDYDTSCEIEITSGGHGRTCTTMIVTPFTTMSSSSSSKLFTWIMEYQFSGFYTNLFNWSNNRWLYRKQQPQEQLEQKQQYPQHWIRQIWELDHPRNQYRDNRRRFRRRRHHSLASSTSDIRDSTSGSQIGMISKAQYQWLIVWPSGQSIRTIFDPPKTNYKSYNDWNSTGNDNIPYKNNGGLTITWTDPTMNHRKLRSDYWDTIDSDDDDADMSSPTSQSSRSTTTKSGDGRWITDIYIPFMVPPSGTNTNIQQQRQQSLLFQNLAAAEIRVRRQFCF